MKLVIVIQWVIAKCESPTRAKACHRLGSEVHAQTG